MIYECEICETVLPPGARVCPGCGDVFDEPVPDDAVGAEQPVSAAPAMTAVAETPVAETPIPEPEPFPEPVVKTPSFPEPEPIRLRETEPAAEVFPEEDLAASGPDVEEDEYDDDYAPHAARKFSVWRGMAVVLVLAAAVFLVVHLISARQHSLVLQPPGTGPEGTLIGAPLKIGGKAEIVLLAPRAEDIQAFTKANVTGDTYQMRSLVDSGRVYQLPSGQVKAQLIYAMPPGFIEVSILSGSHQGEEAWTYKESLQI